MFTSLWFEAVPLPDDHERAEQDMGGDANAERVWYRAQVFCAEYCGAGGSWDPNSGHATMYAQILVQHPRDFDEWLAHPPPPRCPPDNHVCSDVEWGELLFAQKGCTACHQREEGGPQLAGPSFAGLFGRQERLVGGESITVDRAYVEHSIREPRAQVVDGFNPVMPQIPMSDQQLEALIAYLQTL
jgi:cytochrome c oxidase subunit 2